MNRKCARQPIIPLFQFLFVLDNSKLLSYHQKTKLLDAIPYAESAEKRRYKMSTGFIRYGQSLVVSLSLLATLQTYGAPARVLTVGEGFVDPVGFYDATPTFSWKLPDGM